MKVLVTGSSGFIGQALVRRLKAAGWEVAGLDKGAGAPSKYLCDILDAARLTESVQHCSPDALVHLAERALGSGLPNLGGVIHSDNTTAQGADRFRSLP